MIGDKLGLAGVAGASRIITTMSLKAKLEAIIYAAETPVTLDQLIELVKESVLSEGAADGTESNEVAGTPRSCLSAHRRSDRPAIVRDDRVAARGCLARSRRTCALLGKRTKGTLYTLGQTHGRGPQSLDSGARQRRF